MKYETHHEPLNSKDVTVTVDSSSPLTCQPAQETQAPTYQRRIPEPDIWPTVDGFRKQFSEGPDLAELKEQRPCPIGPGLDLRVNC